MYGARGLTGIVPSFASDDVRSYFTSQGVENCLAFGDFDEICSIIVECKIGRIAKSGDVKNHFIFDDVFWDSALS